VCLTPDAGGQGENQMENSHAGACFESRGKDALSGKPLGDQAKKDASRRAFSQKILHQPLDLYINMYHTKPCQEGKFHGIAT
jgi:hypothetical protein